MTWNFYAFISRLARDPLLFVALFGFVLSFKLLLFSNGNCGVRLGSGFFSISIIDFCVSLEQTGRRVLACYWRAYKGLT